MLSWESLFEKTFPLKSYYLMQFLRPLLSRKRPASELTGPSPKAGVHEAGSAQNVNRSANCMTRGSPDSVVMLAALPLVILPFGWPNSGVFVTLKTSQRASTL